MTFRQITDELMGGWHPLGLFSLATEEAAIRGYSARLIQKSENRATISIYASGVRSRLGWLRVTQIPVTRKNGDGGVGARCQAYCVTDWRTTGADLLYAPCETMASILKVIMNVYDAPCQEKRQVDEWRAPWEAPYVPPLPKTAEQLRAEMYPDLKTDEERIQRQQEYSLFSKRMWSLYDSGIELKEARRRASVGLPEMERINALIEEMEPIA